MKTCFRLFVGVVAGLTYGLSLAGCGEEATAPEVAAPSVEISAPAPLTLEVGCAKCIYQVDGAKGCSQVAVVVEGNPLLICGVQIDAHGAGLCGATKMASVEGTVEDGKFIASKVEVQ